MADNSPAKIPALLNISLRRLLGVVFLLFALLAVNSIYLAAITLLEFRGGEIYQDYFYLMMFLLHLLLGLLLIPPFLIFGISHYRRARHRANRYAIRAGKVLFFSGLLVLISGLVLTRFGFFEINDPNVRQATYWLHILTPLIAAWLFIIHRLAGPAIHWRRGGYWATAAILLTAVLSVVHIQTRQITETGAPAYEPGLARIVGGQSTIPAEHLDNDAVCAECHADIAEQTAMSMHRLSSFNNPAYRATIDDARKVLLQRDGEVKVARLCAVCHDQVPLFSGKFDDPNYDPDSDPGSQAGITCVGCHAITAINSPKGNGSYDIADPPRYPFAFSENVLLKAINRQLIKAKPAHHKKTFLKPVHKKAEFCAACHKVHLPYALNHYKWLRGQNHYDSFLLSGVSGHRVDSFYYPQQAVVNCAQCHMPPEPSDDPAARDFAGKDSRTVHNHMFAAANTGVPHLLGHPQWTHDIRQGFMQQAARIDIFGLKEQGDIDGKLHAPLRPQVPTLQPGQRYLIELVVRTKQIGHQLTQGTTDSNELWLELSLKSGDKVIGRSGGLNGEGDVDPWSYFINSYLLDRNGNRIKERDAQNIFVPLYDHQIPPGAATTVHYAFEVPHDAKGPLTLEAGLKYRKFDTRFLRYVKGEAFQRNDLPITTMATDRLSFPVAGAGEGVPDQNRGIEPWQRWNDYGIGLLRKGKHELRQAETAFKQVERLKPAHGAINLARVHFREGRLDDAAGDLHRAVEAGAPPWTVSWLSARVDREYGRLDQAIERLEGLIETRFQQARERGFDFSKDYRVLNELGRTLYERARKERGKARKAQRNNYLQQAKHYLQQALKIDPENLQAHYNLAQVYKALGDPKSAVQHRTLHDKYRPDDHAIEMAVTAHRSSNPAADHAAEETAVYDLQRPGAYGLPLVDKIAQTPDQ